MSPHSKPGGCETSDAMAWAQRSHYDRKTLIAENNLLELEEQEAVRQQLSHDEAEAKVSDRARQQKQRGRDDPSKP